MLNHSAKDKSRPAIKREMTLLLRCERGLGESSIIFGKHY